MLAPDVADAAAEKHANGTGDNGAGASEVGPYHSHWASVIGAFKGEPAFDELMEIIRQRRREMNAEDSIA